VAGRKKGSKFPKRVLTAVSFEVYQMLNEMNNASEFIREAIIDKLIKDGVDNVKVTNGNEF
jgi:hypothetical protein